MSTDEKALDFYPGMQIDATIGEVLPAQAFETNLVINQTKDDLAAIVNQTNVPIHIAKMKEYHIPPEMMASYINAPWYEFLQYVIKVVDVAGMCIWFSGPFSPQGKPENYVETGYHTVLIKLAETRTVKGVPVGKQVLDIEQNVIIKVSAKRVAEMAMVYLETNGWFDWSAPVQMLLGGNKDSGYLMQPISAILAQQKK